MVSEREFLRMMAQQEGCPEGMKVRVRLADVVEDLVCDIQKMCLSLVWGDDDKAAEDAADFLEAMRRDIKNNIEKRDMEKKVQELWGFSKRQE